MLFRNHSHNDLASATTGTFRDFNNHPWYSGSLPATDRMINRDFRSLFESKQKKKDKAWEVKFRGLLSMLSPDQVNVILDILDEPGQLWRLLALIQGAEGDAADPDRVRQGKQRVEQMVALCQRESEGTGSADPAKQGAANFAIQIMTIHRSRFMDFVESGVVSFEDAQNKFARQYSN